MSLSKVTLKPMPMLPLQVALPNKAPALSQTVPDFLAPIAKLFERWVWNDCVNMMGHGALDSTEMIWCVQDLTS
jgi:hypothetical protein